MQTSIQIQNFYELTIVGLVRGLLFSLNHSMDQYPKICLAVDHTFAQYNRIILIPIRQRTPYSAALCYYRGICFLGFQSSVLWKKRFPDDFMFQLSKEEFGDLMFQNGISSSGWGGTRKMPYAFTEQGVAMLSGVLNSDVAIEVNIRIIRIFTRLREMLLTHKDILLKLDELEKKTLANNDDIQLIFEALKQLLHTPDPPRKRIGFRRNDEKD